MTEADLIDAVAGTSGLAKGAAARVVQYLFGKIAAGLRKGEEVRAAL